MKTLLSLLLSIACFNSYCQCIHLQCLSEKENTSINSLFERFEQKLLLHYGNLETNILLHSYITDFSTNKINSKLFDNIINQSDRLLINDLAIKVSKLPSYITADKDGNPVEELEITPLFTKTKKEPTVKPDPLVLNTEGNIYKCFVKTAKSQSIKNLLEIHTYAREISTRVIAGGLESFTQQDLKDEVLQAYVMIELFLLPKLNLEQ